MRVVITGSNGFIGRNLTAALSTKYDVLALSRHSTYDKCTGVTPVYTDYSLANLREILAGADAVIHLAAKRSISGNTHNLIDNIQLDYRLFQAAEDCSVKHVLFASTRGVYGSQPAPWSEVTPPAPLNLYALAKLHSEETAAFFVRRGLRITTLRIAQVFGLGEYSGSAVATFLRNAYEGKPILLTATGISREYLYVSDLASAIEKVLKQPISGIYNLGSGEVMNLEDMARAVQRAFGRQSDILITDPKKMEEYTLMDSTSFRQCFSWKPEFSFATAAKDIARMLDKKGNDKIVWTIK